MHANLWLAGALRRLVDQVFPVDLKIRLARGADPAELGARPRELQGHIFKDGKSVHTSHMRFAA